jgi:transcriptional regulator with XRE-family HTH domain
MQPVDTVRGMKSTRPRNRATPESIELGKRLLKALDLSGKNQSDLARALDVNRQAIQQLCAGFNDNPSMKRIFRIADELGVAARWLGMGEGPMNDAPLTPVEYELMTLFRQLLPERQAEVTGFARGLVGAAAQPSKAAAKALEDFVTSMSKDDAAKLGDLLLLLQKAKNH